jgi:hypothetical protein
VPKQKELKKKQTQIKSHRKKLKDEIKKKSTKKIVSKDIKTKFDR